MVVESTVRETAIAYAERELYDGAVEVTFVGMADAPKGTRVGLEVQLKDGSLFGAFLGALVGAFVGVLLSLILVFVLPQLIPVLVVAGVAGGAYVLYRGMAPTEYATVTVDTDGGVVMSNRDYEAGDFDDVLDRRVSARGAEARHEADAKRRAEPGPSPFEVMDAFFGSGDTSSGSDDAFTEPDRCPECGERDTLLSPQFSELGPGRYQCADCGHIVNLAGSD
ncbi:MULTISPECIES: hypothetical protein [Halorubrum]|uniref:TFIIB-type domain-containing protein n=2 Tax=Halorubrum TaxID=56688 RepID=A0A1I6FLR3_HALSD|nr:MULTISPECIES: hypothetical protein [Halorubrum]TKX67877.1 hypothetical protein EXE45_12980 [Halorubrum sp. SP9]SFR30895.1 hypothetical protein SAMN04487937_0728 [Halorubrum sodomense]